MLLIVKFLVSFFLFFLSVLACLYLPGFWLLKKSKLKTDKIEEFSLSLSLGIVFFVLLALVLGYLKLRFLLLPIIFFVLWSVFKNFGFKAFSGLKIRQWKLQKRKVFFLILVSGIIAQLWINIFSGWQYADGVRFWSAHGHDGVWHGSLMQEIRDRFPPRMRFIGGFELKNYHYFVDILMGEFYRLFGFGPLDLYFRHFTFLFAALFLLGCFVFVRNWRHEKAGVWAMFFAIFGGSFGYLITVVRNQTILGVRSEAAFWVSQGNTAVGNPPQIVAFILFLTFLNLFYRWFQKENWSLFWILAVLGSMLFGFKIYAGATILGGLFLIGLWQIFFQRKTEALKLFLAVFLPSLLVFFSTTSKGQSFLVFQPWWFIRTMIVAGDRLGWVDLEMKRQFYLAQHNWRGYLRVFQFELMALVIFIVGNLGTKILGLGEFFRILFSRFRPALFDLFLIFCTLVCFVFPHVFVQKGVAWNTVQFFHYFVLLMILFSGVEFGRLMASKKKFKKAVLVGLIILFSIPTVLADLIFFSPGNSLAVIENEELEALTVLKEKTSQKEAVLTYPFNRWVAGAFLKQPRPIYSWYSTGYVAYFADRMTFITDEEQVEIMGYSEGKKRIAELKEFLFDDEGRGIKKDAQKARRYLLENDLRYAYLVYDQEFAFDPREAGFEKIFENEVARIYKLNE